MAASDFFRDDFFSKDEHSDYSSIYFDKVLQRLSIASVAVVLLVLTNLLTRELYRFFIIC
jgi:hypothetical protein